MSEVGGATQSFAADYPPVPLTTPDDEPTTEVPLPPALQVNPYADDEPSTPEPTQYSHNIRSGDTLLTLAARYQISPNQIIEANGLANPNLLRAGKDLIIPLGGDKGGVMPQPVAWHQGTTLASMAAAHHTTESALRRANFGAFKDGKQPEEGQPVWIPGSPDPTQGTEPEQQPAAPVDVAPETSANAPDHIPPELPAVEETASQPPQPSEASGPALQSGPTAESTPKPGAATEAEPEACALPPAATAEPAATAPPKAPYEITVGVSGYLQGGGGTKGGHTERFQLDGRIPLNDSGTANVRLLATQDRRDAFGDAPPTYLTRAYAALQLGQKFKDPDPNVKLPKAEIGASIGGGIETLENPANSDRLLSRDSTIEVFTLGANGSYRFNNTKLGLNVSALTVRTNDGTDWFRASATPSVTSIIGPVEVSFGVLAQTDQISTDRPADSSFIATTAALTYRNPVADVSLQVWNNVAGKFASPAINALPLAGGQEDSWKLMVGVSHKFTVAR